MYPNLAAVASLIGDPARAAMLFALLDGRESPATQLALSGNTSPQAASAHLKKLVDGGLLDVRSEGRQRLYRLASSEVAHAIETLASIAPAQAPNSLRSHSALERLREARSCYDHLAGRLGVAVTQSLCKGRYLSLRGDEFTLTRSGNAFLRELHVDVDAARDSKRAFARACLDWTERTPHLAGSLGAALLDALLTDGWVKRSAHDRSLQITDRGRAQFKRLLNV
jgi:DNA-binding transcriptional ArsR family regulator